MTEKLVIEQRKNKTILNDLQTSGREFDKNLKETTGSKLVELQSDVHTIRKQCTELQERLETIQTQRNSERNQ